MEFKEEYLFHKYKDSHIGNVEHFRSMLAEYKGIDCKKIYTEIINYQVKKYGSSLQGESYERVDTEKAAHRAHNRHYRRRKSLGIKSRNSRSF